VTYLDFLLCGLKLQDVSSFPHFFPFLRYLFRPPDVSREGLKFYPQKSFLSFLFLSIHRAQQSRSGWPSNVFRRFGRR